MASRFVEPVKVLKVIEHNL